VPSGRPRVDGGRLDALVEVLRAAPVDPGLVTRLRTRILEGSEDQLTRIRAFQLADSWGSGRDDVLHLLLHATRAGLFVLSWQLMCPNCRVPKADVDHLGELPPRFHCDTCGIVYTVDVDRHLELRFSVDPGVRVTRDEIYCVGGPLRMPHVVAQQHLSAHEDRRVELALTEPLQLRAIGGATEELRLVPGPRGRTAEVRLTYAAGRWTGPHSLDRDRAISVPEGADLILRNQTEGFVLALLESLERTRDATSLADVAGLDEFVDLFDPEAIVRVSVPRS
jgi:adenylate cyclase